MEIPFSAAHRLGIVLYCQYYEKHFLYMHLGNFCKTHTSCNNRHIITMYQGQVSACDIKVVSLKYHVLL